MIKKQILAKAIEKAEKNGFKYYDDWKGRDEAIFYLDSWHSLVFDHDFAKAFWGEKLQLGINLSHPLNDSFGEPEFKVACPATIVLSFSILMKYLSNIFPNLFFVSTFTRFASRLMAIYLW